MSAMYGLNKIIQYDIHHIIIHKSLIGLILMTNAHVMKVPKMIHISQERQLICIVHEPKEKSSVRAV